MHKPFRRRKNKKRLFAMVALALLITILGAFFVPQPSHAHPSNSSNPCASSGITTTQEANSKLANLVMYLSTNDQQSVQGFWNIILGKTINVTSNQSETGNGGLLQQFQGVLANPDTSQWDTVIDYLIREKFTSHDAKLLVNQFFTNLTSYYPGLTSDSGANSDYQSLQSLTGECKNYVEDHALTQIVAGQPTNS